MISYCIILLLRLISQGKYIVWNTYHLENNKVLLIILHTCDHCTANYGDIMSVIYEGTQSHTNTPTSCLNTFDICRFSNVTEITNGS